jgi:hypothetical protein
MGMSITHICIAFGNCRLVTLEQANAEETKHNSLFVLGFFVVYLFIP